MSILSNVLKNKFGAPEIKLEGSLVAELFLKEIIKQSSIKFLSVFRNEDLILMIEIMQIELNRRNPHNHFIEVKSTAGIP